MLSLYNYVGGDTKSTKTVGGQQCWWKLTAQHLLLMIGGIIRQYCQSTCRKYAQLLSCYNTCGSNVPICIYCMDDIIYRTGNSFSLNVYVSW